MKKTVLLCVVLLSVIILSACGMKRPVLYPNEAYEQASYVGANEAINNCMQMASEYGADENRGNEVAKDTAESAAIGGASGAVVGAIVDDLGKGAAIGAAGAGAAALIRGLFRLREPQPVFRSFVDKCLRDQGFEPIGWQ